MTKPKLWTKDFIVVGLLNFFISLNFYLLMVITSSFTMEKFKSSPGEAGFATGIFVIGALIARLFCGKWIERTGRRNMLLAGLALTLVVSILYFTITGITFLYILRFFHGTGFGISLTTAGTIAASIIPKERTGEGLGYYMLSITLATAIGTFFSIFIGQRGNFDIIFAASVVSAALCFTNFLFLSVPEIDLTKQQLDTMKGVYFRNFLEPKVIPICIICGIIYFCYSSVLSFLAVYAKEIRLAQDASFFFVAYSVAVLLSRPYSGRLFDCKGENATMYPAILIFVIGMIVLSQTQNRYTLLSAGGLIGIGSGTVQSISQSICVRVTPAHRIGMAISTFWIFIDLGTGVGPFILGLLIPFTGYRVMYAYISIVGFACVFLYYILHGKRMAHEKMKNVSGIY